MVFFQQWIWLVICVIVSWNHLSQSVEFTKVYSKCFQQSVNNSLNKIIYCQPEDDLFLDKTVSLPQDVEQLFVYSTKSLANLKRAFLVNATSLQKLVFVTLNVFSGFSGIADIEDNVFENCYKLQYLDLSYNKIWRITNATFNGLTKLKHLNLNGNCLLEIDAAAFNNFRRSIHYLYISVLPSLDLTNQFEEMNNLQTLKIKLDNGFEYRSKQSKLKLIIANLTKLENLIIASNMLDVWFLEQNSIYNLPNLKDLKLGKFKYEENAVQLFGDLRFVELEISTNKLMPTSVFRELVKCQSANYQGLTVILSMDNREIPRYQNLSELFGFTNQSFSFNATEVLMFDGAYKYLIKESVSRYVFLETLVDFAALFPVAEKVSFHKSIVVQKLNKKSILSILQATKLKQLSVTLVNCSEITEINNLSVQLTGKEHNISINCKDAVFANTHDQTVVAKWNLLFISLLYYLLTVVFS